MIIRINNRKKETFKIIFDKKDFTEIIKHKWYICKMHNLNYAATRISNKIVLMHRFIISPEGDYIIDHKNNNGLDNRRKNLRICNYCENSRNRRINKNNKSKLKGVSRSKSKTNYRAQIMKDRKNIHLGSFKNKKLAYLAYCEAAKKYHGEFGRIK